MVTPLVRTSSARHRGAALLPGYTAGRIATDRQGDRQTSRLKQTGTQTGIQADMQTLNWRPRFQDGNVHTDVHWLVWTNQRWSRVLSLTTETKRNSECVVVSALSVYSVQLVSDGR